MKVEIPLPFNHNRAIIPAFTGKHDFLSNDFSCSKRKLTLPEESIMNRAADPDTGTRGQSVVPSMKGFSTLTQYLQAWKTLDPHYRKQIRDSMHLDAIKKLDQKTDFPLRNFYSKASFLHAFKQGLAQKFCFEQNPTFAQGLVNTGDALLFNGHTSTKHQGPFDELLHFSWETGQGQNLLGKLLMERRQQLTLYCKQ